MMEVTIFDNAGDVTNFNINEEGNLRVEMMADTVMLYSKKRVKALIHALQQFEKEMVDND